MATLIWEFAGYTFTVDSQPTRGGAGDWNKKRKVVVQEPLNSDIDVLIDFGFASGRRTIRGRASKAFRDQMLTFFGNRTIGDLTDAENRAQSAQILEANFSTVLPDVLYDFTITFIAR